MGCGASILGTRPKKQPLLLADRRGLVTPPTGSRPERGPPAPAGGGGVRRPTKGLKIDTAAAAREKAGLAETPIGKVADEYKYYCPICMMFFRSILELPCCQQSTCSFCFSEYLQRQRPPPAEGEESDMSTPRAPPYWLPAGTALSLIHI